jgi:hypothetical protein
MPVLWIRDSSERRHTTQADGSRLTGRNGEVVPWPDIMPTPDRVTIWIDVAAAEQSA